MASSRQKSTRPVLQPLDPARLAGATELAARAPKPAVFDRVRTGTAGWTDRTLLESGLFYPRGANSPQARLEYYAEHFAFVEVDATYYALLPPETAARWVAWTPQHFEFDVKAFPLLTGHPIDVRKLPADLRAECEAQGFPARVYPDALPETLSSEIVRRFVAFLEPLASAGRLSSLLLQYPPWFSANEQNSKRIEQARAELGDLPLSIEFRHPSWFESSRKERVTDLLRALQMSFVCIDQPLIPSELLVVTQPKLAVVRFHGRNLGGWQKRGASVWERFDYLYEARELEAFVRPIQELAGQAERVHAVFNNCVRNYAVLNAQELATLLVESHE